MKTKPSAETPIPRAVKVVRKRAKRKEVRTKSGLMPWNIYVSCMNECADKRALSKLWTKFKFWR